MSAGRAAAAEPRPAAAVTTRHAPATTHRVPADSGYFVVTLGQDTTSIEHYTRTPAHTEVDQVGRAPRVLQRKYTYDYSKGVIRSFRMVVTPPGGITPTQTIVAVFGPDSMRMMTTTGSAPPENQTIAVPPGAVVVTNSSPWTGFERQIMKLVQGKGDSLRAPIYYIGADNTNWVTVQKLGRDSVALVTDRPDVFHVQVDHAGRILGVLPVTGTGKFAVARPEKLDMDAMTADFVAREKAGAGLGTLSPRDTVRVANLSGASILIDYGRPAKRGRTIFGSVVPYGSIWRTGANSATQISTDKALDFGGTVVPPGKYTLWTLPGTTSWKLIVNSETGEWGTEHKPEKDLYTIDMKVSTLPAVVERFTISVAPTAQGGTLNLDWDTTRASADFVVKP